MDPRQNGTLNPSIYSVKPVVTEGQLDSGLVENSEFAVQINLQIKYNFAVKLYLICKFALYNMGIEKRILCAVFEKMEMWWKLAPYCMLALAKVNSS